MAVTKKVVDGFGLVETTDEGHSVIEKLQQQLKDANAATQTAKDALSAKDGEMAVLTATHADAIKAKDDEVAAAKALSDTAALDARVAARTKLVADAKKIAGSDLETDGKSDLDIQKAAITKKLGDDAVKDKPDTFFASAFDFAALTAKDWAGDEEEEEEPDALRDALNPKTARDKAPASYEARMAARYQGAN